MMLHYICKSKFGAVVMCVSHLKAILNEIAFQA